MQERRRYQLLLGKFQVTRVTRELGQLRMAIELPGLGHMIVDIPPTAYVREGDLLTFYTEILSANPNPTPIQ
jgi:hypothetical protein